MIIRLNTEKKTIQVEDTVNLQELVTFLNDKLQINWHEYSLVPITSTIPNWTMPYEPNTNPDIFITTSNDY